MSEKIKDPGIGITSAEDVGRLIDDNGYFNVKHQNKPKRFSEAYNYLVNLPWWYFLLLSLFAYVLANIIFACIYVIIGLDQITLPPNNNVNDFLNAFYFSSQTFTTLGYGVMSPNGIASGIIASIEAFVGLTFFAFTTGLLYGRFSKPKASIRFSKHIVLNNLSDNTALMFRIENDRRSTMIYPKVSVTLTLSKKNKRGEYTNSFYNLNLVRDTINYLPTTWTVVHEIDKDSPFFGLSNSALTQQQGELIVMVSYYDEAFNQEVHQINSYMLKDIALNYKFVKAYYYNSSGEIILDHKRFNLIESTKG